MNSVQYHYLYHNSLVLNILIFILIIITVLARVHSFLMGIWHLQYIYAIGLGRIRG